MYCRPIKKSDCKTIEDHAKRLADIYMDCRSESITFIELNKVVKENNFNYNELVSKVANIVSEMEG